jgi:hypothetical protein
MPRAGGSMSTDLKECDALWENFIAELNKERPLVKLGDHKAFIGSIEAYKNIYMRACTKLKDKEDGRTEA